MILRVQAAKYVGTLLIVFTVLAQRSVQRLCQFFQRERLGQLQDEPLLLRMLHGRLFAVATDRDGLDFRIGALQLLKCFYASHTLLIHQVEDNKVKGS